MAAAVALGATLLMNTQASAEMAIGRPAPDFVAVDTSGRTHRLSDFAGRFVVLEWTNPACPVVGTHYQSGNLPATQKRATARGAVWLAIASSGRHADDYLKPAQIDAWMAARDAAPTAVLMDEDGIIGRAYGAQATPQIFIVDPQGTLVYSGAIDNMVSTHAGDVPRGATNYVEQALAEAYGARPVSAALTRPYGSPIRYQT
jgi:peroxiredoxin